MQPDSTDLFTYGTEPPKLSRTLKVILTVVITLAVGGGAWALYRRSANASRGKEAKRPQLVERTDDEIIRDAVLSCLAQPGFVGTKVSEQMLGPVHLELVQVSDQEIYFSAPAPETLGEKFEWIVAPFIIDQKLILDLATGKQLSFQ